MRPLKLKKKPLRIDRQVGRSEDPLAVFDLELLHRSFTESLLAAKLFRSPAIYLRGPKSAAPGEASD